jgi:hypothetical protein
MRFAYIRPVAFGVLGVAAVTAALIFISNRWGTRTEQTDWTRALASQLGLDDSATASLVLEIPPQGTRSPGVVITRRKSLVHGGSPKPELARRINWGTANFELDDLYDARGGFGLSFLRTAVSGSGSLDVEVALDSATIVEFSHEDLRAYAERARLGSLPRADSAFLIERALEARVVLTVKRQSKADRSAWVRDSATAANEATGGRLILNRGQGNSFQIRTPDRVFVAYATIPLCDIAKCGAGDTTPPNQPVVPTPPVLREAEEEQPPARRRTHSVTITATPPDAEVYLGDTFIGNANAEYQVPEGEHMLTIRKAGFQPYTNTIRVPGRTLITARLRPL